MMDRSEIEFYRNRGYAYLGTDGETYSFLRGQYAYMYHEDIGFMPLAKLTRPYSRARHEFGSDHATVADLLMCSTDTRHYAELNDVSIYPNQRTAWTLPVDQEC